MSSISQLVPGLILILLAAIPLMALYAAPWTGFVLLGGSLLWDSVSQESFSGILIGGFNLYPPDAVAALLVAISVIRIFQRLGRTDWRTVATLTFFLILLASAAVGTSTFGLKTTVNDSRPYFYFAATTLFMLGYPRDKDLFGTVTKAWLAISASLLVLVVIRWLLVIIGLAPETVDNWRAAGGLPIRTIYAPPALLLAQTAILGAYFDPVGRRQKRYVRFLLPACIAATIALQHRSVWVAFLIGGAVVMLREKSAASLWPRVIGVGIVVAAMGLGLFFSSGALGGSLSTSAEDTDTLEWRQNGWAELVRAAMQDPDFSFVSGRPLGSGYIRFSAADDIGVSPHNFYLQLFLDTGVVGLALLMTVYFATLAGLWRSPLISRGHRAVATLLLMQMAYWFFYGETMEQGILLGLAIRMFRSRLPTGSRMNERIPVLGRRNRVMVPAAIEARRQVSLPGGT